MSEKNVEKSSEYEIKQMKTLPNKTIVSSLPFLYRTRERERTEVNNQWVTKIVAYVFVSIANP